MMPISSAMAKASCWSWVTRMAVVPLALRMSRTSSDRRSRRSTSRLENGSSSSSRSRLRRQRARQRHALLLAAGQFVRVTCRPAPARPTVASSSCYARGASAAGHAAQAEADVVAPPSGAGTGRSPGTPCRCGAAPAAACTAALLTTRRLRCGSRRAAAARSRRCSAAPWSCRSPRARAGSRCCRCVQRRTTTGPPRGACRRRGQMLMAVRAGA